MMVYSSKSWKKQMTQGEELTCQGGISGGHWRYLKKGGMGSGGRVEDVVHIACWCHQLN